MRYLAALLLGLLLLATPANAARDNVTETGVKERCYDEGEMNDIRGRYSKAITDANRLTEENKELRHEVEQLKSTLTI